MRGLELETSELQQLVDAEVPDLAPALDAINSSLAEWWDPAYLAWFTDHGPAHSNRVADYAARLVQTSGDRSLNAVEGFILLAASLLHDVGMQVAPPGTELGKMTESDFVAMRRDHPSRSLEVITTRAEEFGLPGDPALIESVALVARAHGTQYYESGLSDLRAVTHVRNQPVRLPLLGATLLLADELDLHYERASLPDPAKATLNRISRAHHFKHQYVRSVDVGVKAGVAKIEVGLRVPTEVREEAVDLICRWIRGKLQRQIGLVEPVLLEGWAGSLRVSRGVAIQCSTALVSHEIIDSHAERHMEAEVVKADVIDFGPSRAELKSALPSLSVLALVGASPTPADGDPEGREDVLSDLYHNYVDGGVGALSRRLGLNDGGNLFDVVSEWCSSLGLIAPAVEPSSARLKNWLATADQSVLLGVSSLELMDADSRKDLLQFLSAEIVSGKVILLYTADDVYSVPGVPEPAYTVTTFDEPNQAEVERYFRRFVGVNEAIAISSAGIGYGALRSLAHAHEMKLAET